LVNERLARTIPITTTPKAAHALTRGGFQNHRAGDLGGHDLHEGIGRATGDRDAGATWSLSRSQPPAARDGQYGGILCHPYPADHAYGAALPTLHNRGYVGV
jgi:hypothetical protein